MPGMLGNNQSLDQDRAIELPEQDVLDRDAFVDSLVRALVTDIRDAEGKLIGWRSNGYVVGLTGPWGLGKSSILNLVADKLGSMSNVIVVTFNPWLFNGRDELLKGFFSELRAAMGRSEVDTANELREALDKYWGAINFAAHTVAAIVDAHGGGGAATAWWAKWGKKAKDAVGAPTDLSPEERRKSLEEKIANGKVAVAVLIDELDRVEDAEVRAVAQLVKAVGDIKGVSYLVAYDADRVTDALGRGDGDGRKESGMRYLEKIVQYPVPLRPLFSEDVDALFSALLAHHQISLPEPESDHERQVLSHLKLLITTPRDVKRLVGAFAIIERAVRQEISAVDVLAYSWLLTKAPIVRDAIAAQLDKVVDDPAEDELLKRFMGKEDETNSTLDPAVILGIPLSDQLSGLIRLLFPRFWKERLRDDSGMRLSRRRNLVRLLYLGNPPGAFSRAQIERIWAMQELDGVEIALRREQSEGKLTSLLDRMDDVLPHLAEGGDAIFWPALSRVLTRSDDWVTGAEPGYARIDDAATMLMRLGMRDQNKIPRVKAVIEALIIAGDLVIVPFILRKHLFAHGLTKHGSARGGETIYAKDETEQLYRREMPRYRAAVQGGVALRRLPNLEAIFVLANRNDWDDDLRVALTSQLQGLEALSTMASLLLPPGYGTELSTMDELFDVEAVRPRVEAVGDDTEVLESWVAQSLRRFRSILAGEAD